MSLRIQLLALAALTLALPWAGYRYVQELEGALRNGLEQALLASASTVATALGNVPLAALRTAGTAAAQNTIYAHPLSAAPELDGYRNDWTLAEAAARALGDSNRYWVGIHERSVYLFIEAADDSLVYQSTPTERPYGDRVLILPQGPGADWLLLHTLAPGILRPQRTSPPEFVPSARYETRVAAYWRETGTGYALEIRMPVELVGGRLGLALIDVDASAGEFAVTLESSWPVDTSLPTPFLVRPPALEALGRQFEQPAKRLRIVDADGWVLFDGGAIDPLAQGIGGTPVSLAEQFLSLILARGDPPYSELESPPGYLGDSVLRDALRGPGAIAWYARGTEASAVVVAVAPIATDEGITGAVILEQGSDAILTLTNEALVELMTFTLGASLLVALGLLSYATYLSFRVRRLARAADTALGPKGEIEPILPGHRARDEIGDLSRSFSSLLARLRDHTRYLTTLKGKLAHELRTPLAVVATSLDNLEREPHEKHLVPYLSRLREGTDRLDSILAAMSEATALEQAVTSMSREPFELGAVVRGCIEGYADVYRDRSFDYVQDAGIAKASGSADLIAQMLDKLVDNAVSFSAPGTTISIGLRASGDEHVISVANEGPTLPASMRTSLFDSLVSVRERDNHKGHLGLGLYVVALIAEFHRGAVDARDLPDASGVVFTVALPTDS
ncbi:MAG: ATP-binding protein [Gammaproteobacteria bacterium]|nr:ATP-binding protein [Gammaproteobacteria bacterium]